MKKLLLVAASMAVLMGILLIGAGAVFKPSVEDVTRYALTNLGGPGMSTVDKVEFSFLTRSITVTGWKRTSARTDVPVASCATITGTVTVRGMLTCLPIFGNIFYDADTLVPVMQDVRISQLTWDGHNLRGEAQTIFADTLTMPYSLARQFAGGQRPPFASTVNGVRMNRLHISGLCLNAYPAARYDNLTVRADDIEFLETAGTNASLATLDNLIFDDDNATVTVRHLRFEKLHITPELLSELLAFIPRTAYGIPDSLLNCFTDNGPLYARTVSENITCNGTNTYSWTAGSIEHVWDREQAVIHCRDVTLSSEILADLPMYTSGLTHLELECDISIDFPDDVVRLGIDLRSPELADVRLGLEILEDDQLGNLSLTMTDHGLTPRLSLAVAPDAHAAGMFLKAGVMRLCQNDTPADQMHCQRLADFVDAPGTFSLHLYEGRTVDVMTMLYAAAGNFGSIFSVEVKPSTRTLSRQCEDLLAGRTGS